MTECLECNGKTTCGPLELPCIRCHGTGEDPLWRVCSEERPQLNVDSAEWSYKVTDHTDTSKRIVGVAIVSDETGQLFWLNAPNRHHHVIRVMAKRGLSTPIVGCQGFVTDTGLFVNRVRALQIAREANQLINPNPMWQLYSEDLW